ncbi:MAG: VacB/RNase II family 3'-5' exoribonuclease [Leptospiraceae bacterium]|nr:VacB/RNase II family 3'-5' exoribonuclease [Leptospiraceae bacterium]
MAGTLSKITEYLALKAGSEVKQNELFDKFLFKKDKKNKHSHKQKKHKSKDKFEEKQDEVLTLLKLLEDEGLIIINKRTIEIHKPFRLTGTISISRRGDGFVKLSSGNEVFVPAELTEGSITGDTVELLPIGKGKKERLEGEVKSILKRGRVFYRMKITETDGNYFYGKLLDMTGEYKEGVLRKKTLLQDIINSLKVDDVIIVKLKDDSFYDNNIYEVGFIKYESGSTRDKDLNRILMKYNYNQQYPDHSSLDFEEEINENTIPDWGSRVDLRDSWCVTIDGANSKDFDDAIGLEEEPNGVVKFYVHIADVSHYVKQGSPMDDEAYERATSVYLVDSVVPMLPPILSENLCSLVAGKNRLAFTVEMAGDYNGKIFSAKFYKSIIKVSGRMTYDSAQEEINANDQNNKIVKLMNLARGLKNARINSGRVDLNLKEVYIKTEEDGTVTEIKNRERLESHILIEELMLSANTKVAEFIRKKKAPNLYRIHEAMDEEKLETLNVFLQLYGINHTIHSTDYNELKLALGKMEGHESQRVFNYFLLRSFMQAYYGGETLGHWGLGFKDYCHFTSPIRRYPDLVVHRVLESIINSETFPPYNGDTINKMGIQTSEKERKAADAERDIQKLKACRYLESSGEKKFKGVITGVKPIMVFVELEGFNVEAVIEANHFTNDFELNIPNEFSFISKKNSKTYYLGQVLNLELDRIDFEEIRIFAKPIF